MPLPNLPASFLYDLTPQYLVDLDQKRLLQAVLGGYQDRIADLRSYTGRIQDLIDPLAPDFSVVIASYTGDAGNVVTKSLDIQQDTPTDGAGLIQWAAQQLGIEEARVTSAIIGTDALRQTSVDTIQLLAATIGATLYPASLPGAPDRRRQCVATHFPRLKIRGTTRSFSVLAKLHGFDEGTLVPLWGRLSPRNPADVGAVENNPDFTAEPDEFPTVETGITYNPGVYNDGPYFAWNSGTLLNVENTGKYYTEAVNGNNPFIRILKTAATTLVPATGVYTLAGGSDSTYASAALGDSGLTAQALVYGADFNGMKVAVNPIGVSGQCEFSILAPLTRAKYRTSLYDARALVVDPPLAPVAVNADLLANPDLVPDGTAVAPWRPWAGSVPRTQASLDEMQVDADTIKLAAEQLFSSIDDVQVATRRPRSLGYGLAYREPPAYAPYPAGGTYATGTLPVAAVPGADYRVTFYSSGTRVPAQFFAGAYSFGLGTLTGTYVPATRVLTTNGTLQLAFTQVDTGTLTSEPSGPVAYLDRAEDSGTITQRNLLSSFDDIPWARPLLAGGESVDADTFVPFDGDPTPVVNGYKLRIFSTGGVAMQPLVQDFIRSSDPKSYKLIQSTDQSAADSFGYFGGSAAPLVCDDNFVFSPVLASAARVDDRVAWWPLVETPDDLIEPKYTGIKPVTQDIYPFDRVLDPGYGWVCQLRDTSKIYGIAPKADTIGISLRTVLTAGGTVLRHGGLSLVNDGYELTACFNGTTATVLSVGTRFYVESGSNGLVLASQTQRATVIAELSGHESETLEFMGDAVYQLSDVRVFDAAKAANDITQLVQDPVIVTASGTLQRIPWADSTRGDRFTFEIEQGGFSYPSHIAAREDGATPASVMRYIGTGQFKGDGRFKLVGLGNARASGTTAVRLGDEGPEWLASGAVVVSGSNGIVPGLVPSSGTAAIALAQYNAAVDRFYLPGAQGSAYEVSLDDTGSGVFARTRVLVRTVGTSISEFPSGAMQGPVSNGTGLVVDNGTVRAGAVNYSPAPPSYVYLNSRVRVTAAPAFNTWTNRTSYGIALGQAALESNGQLEFARGEYMPAGFYRIAFDIGNNGLLDSDFAGYDVEIALQGSGAATLISATLLPDGKGLNPRGTTEVEFTLPDAYAGPWTFTVSWFNDRDIPSRGQSRSLVIYGFTIRRILSELYRVTTSPFALTPVSLAPVAPGAYTARINSYGTLVEYTHEANDYPTTDGTDTANDSRHPKADILTGSTVGRKEWVRSTTSRRPDPAIPGMPQFGLLTTVVYGPQMATDLDEPIDTDVDQPILIERAGAADAFIGDVLEVIADGSLGYDPLRWVWQMGRSGTVMTTSGTLTHRIFRSGTLDVFVKLVDEFGRSTTTLATEVYVYTPPVMSVVSDCNNRPAPYLANLYAQAFDVEAGGTLNLINWYDANGDYYASGTQLSVNVGSNLTLSAVATSAAGAVATTPVTLVAQRGTPPAVSIASYPRAARADFAQTLTFTALISDIDRRGIESAVWTPWSGDPIFSTITPVDEADGLYFASAVYNKPPGQPAGEVELTLVVTDSAGQRSTTRARVQLVQPSAPEVSIAASNITPAAGAIVTLTATATSPIGAPALEYTWIFSTGVQLYGPTAVLDTSGRSGESISGSLTVSDGEVSTVVATPAIAVG